MPEHCQNVDSISSPDIRLKYYAALRMLDQQLEKLIEEHRPDCLVSDLFHYWAADIAAKFRIPRIVFHGTSHFSMVASECVRLYAPHENVSTESEPFLIPNFPGN